MPTLLQRLREAKSQKAAPISDERALVLAKFIQNNVKDQSFVDKIQYIKMRDGKLRIKVHIPEEPDRFVSKYVNETHIRTQLLTKINKHLEKIGREVNPRLESANGHSVTFSEKLPYTSFTFTLDAENIESLELALGIDKAEQIQIKHLAEARVAAAPKPQAPSETPQKGKEPARGPAAGFFGATTAQPSALAPAPAPAPDGQSNSL